MALNCYTGLMGSGKSYEVVSTILINALAKGRRVVCNIDGLCEEAISEYIFSHFKDVKELGVLVHVSNDEVMQPGFFPTDKTVEDGKSRVRPGDLVIIDECWRFWGTGCKISSEHTEFFRMHRHYVCPDNGQGCDIAMMIQDITTLHRSVRGVVEFSTKTVKLKALGLHKKYRVEMFETGTLRGSTQLDTFVKSYKPEIFPLYSSYKGGSGKEVVVDDRQNILKNRKWYFIIGGIFAVCLFVWSVRYVWHFFHPVQKITSVAAAGVSPGAVPVAYDPTKSELRYVGTMHVLNLGEMAVFSDPVGRLRYEYGSVCSGPRLLVRCKVDGKIVTFNSGIIPSSSSGGFLGNGSKK